MITRKERVINSLRHEPPDLVPWHVDFTIPVRDKLMQYYALDNDAELESRVGNQISFWGGLSTQRTLPYFSARDLKTEIRKLFSELGENGGYVFAPAHAVPKDVPLENVLAMIETLQEQPF